MVENRRDYIEVFYNEREKPLTDYPPKLARHLVGRYGISRGDKFLEVGCGRGEFLRGFIECGVEGYGVDRSNSAERYCPEAELRIADLEKEPLPYEDASFDVVYSKSVIEHFYFPEKLVAEIYRVLRPGGLVLTLCPDWEFHYRMFYADYTHRTAFMQTSLRNIQLIHGFEEVEVERFRQLPALWSAPWLLPIAELTRIAAPRSLKRHSKWVRFSKEIMLLSSARKPMGHADQVAAPGG